MPVLVFDIEAEVLPSLSFHKKLTLCGGYNGSGPVQLASTKTYVFISMTSRNQFVTLCVRYKLTGCRFLSASPRCMPHLAIPCTFALLAVWSSIRPATADLHSSRIV